MGKCVHNRANVACGFGPRVLAECLDYYAQNPVQNLGYSQMIALDVNGEHNAKCALNFVNFNALESIYREREQITLSV